MQGGVGGVFALTANVVPSILSKTAHECLRIVQMLPEVVALFSGR